VTVMVLLMPSCGVGKGGGVGVNVAVQAGLGVWLGVKVGVTVGVWLGVGVFVGVGVWVAVGVAVGVAVSAMVGVGTTVLRTLLSLVGVLATATAVSPAPPLLFKTAPIRKSSMINSSKEPSSSPLRPLLCWVFSRKFGMNVEHNVGSNGRQARFTHGLQTQKDWFC